MSKGLSKGLYEIHVGRTSIEKTGTTPSGKSWTLYRLENWRWLGTQPAFHANVPYKTFDALSGDVEVTVEPFEKNGHLQHYTVKRVRNTNPAKASPAPQAAPDHPELDDLRDRVEALEQLTRSMAAKLRRIPAPESILTVSDPGGTK